MNHTRGQASRGSVLPAPALQQAMQQALSDAHDRALAERLGLSRLAVARIAAGLSVRRATAFVAEMRLGVRSEEPST